MALTPPQVISNSHQAWQLIQRDYTLRLSLVAHEWAEEHQKAKNALFYEARRRGNSGYLGPAWVDMEIANMNKRAEWAYKTCCEIWDIQGRQKCRAFFRAVCDWCVNPMFLTRVGCFEHDFKLHQTRTGRPLHNTSIFGHMRREMGRVASQWYTRLEIATRDNDYQEQQARVRQIQSVSPLAPVSVASVAEGLPVKSRSPMRPKPATRRRMRIIFGVLELGKTGKEYCVEVDREGLRVPNDWLNDQCPRTYAAAYEDGQKWKKRIQDEKSRYQKKYDQMASAERRKIIESATRRTR